MNGVGMGSEAKYGPKYQRVFARDLADEVTTDMAKSGSSHRYAVSGGIMECR
jgi:hypothetical protein